VPLLLSDAIVNGVGDNATFGAEAVSVLHISDLHRDPSHPLRNAPLLDSLETDRERYVENGAIRPPNIVVVSGDIIHGVAADVPDADAKINAQYAEALEFLNSLAQRFVAGNKDRVLIVPGNHDVSAPQCSRSLRSVPIAEGRKKELASQLFSANSPLRWSWAAFSLFEIIDEDAYNMRLSSFCEFYGQFYDGARTFDLDPARQYDVFDFPELGVVLVAFNSCFRNDIFNKQGTIHPDCIADAATSLRNPRYRRRLRMAVWHHNTVGLPMQFDYMDPDVLQNLIDRGFSLGLHGHQHKPQFIDQRFQHDGDRSITVISAGTVCGDAAYRYGRSYNVVELDARSRSGRLHLREMLNDNLELPIWGQRPLPPGTDRVRKFSFDPPPTPLVSPSDQTPALVEGIDLYEKQDYAAAADIFARLADQEDLARRLLLDSYQRLGNSSEILTRFDPPQSTAEAICLMDALWERGNVERLKALLDERIVADSIDPSMIEMRAKYANRTT